MTRCSCSPAYPIWMLLCIVFLTQTIQAEEPDANRKQLLDQENLVAWCIVPFDANKRGPEERAQMLKRLGIRKVAYDWRGDHVSTFEEEILAYQKHGLEFFAFWSWHPSMEALIKKHNIQPQIWKTVPSPKADTQADRVKAAAKQLMPLVEKAAELNLKFGLYNHGGWGGEPENLVAVCKYLREQTKTDHIGIVYNLHHGHGHINDFAEVLDQMEPYLICLNLNGMNEGAQPKILPLNQGQFDKQLLETILKSDYQGPIGILDHRSNMDAEQSLRENLDGLKTLKEKL